MVRRGHALKFDHAVTLGFSRFADFNGRSTHSEFWYFTLFAGVIELAAGFLDERLGTTFGPQNELGTITLIVGLGLFLPRLSVAVRRLHDCNRSGWWILLFPVAFFFFCIKGTEGGNRFGPDALGNGLTGPLPTRIKPSIGRALPSSPPPVRQQPTNTIERIEGIARLAELHAKGILTDEEFAHQKSLLLNASNPA